MMTRLTETQGKRLCELAHLFRKDWDLPGIEAVVRDVAKGSSGIDVARALLNLASNPQAKTPGMLKHTGRHWPTDDHGQPVRTPDQPHPTCPDHPGEDPVTCPQCRPVLIPATPDRIAALRYAARNVQVPDNIKPGDISAASIAAHQAREAAVTVTPAHPTAELEARRNA